MEKLISLKNKYLDKLKKNPKLIVIIGLIGVALIFLSEFLPVSNSSSQKNLSSKATTEEYCEGLENQLSEQISEVVGGKVNVMLTLETGVEYVYASEAKNNESEIEDGVRENNKKKQKEKQNQNNYILYKDENGNEVPLVITEIMPNIKGVVVSCENGENEAVKAIIKNLVKTALNISDERVCVVGLNIS